MKPWTRWEDWTNVVLGVWLFVSTWIFGYAGSAAMNAWILGGLIVVASVWALARPSNRAPDAVNVLFGGWTFIAPWMLQFASVGSAAAWNAWIVGGAVFLVAVLGIPMTTMRFERQHRLIN